MHKVVLEAGSEAELRKVADKLTEAAIDHKLWIEQPENYPTCLAVKPYQKEVLTNGIDCNRRYLSVHRLRSGKIIPYFISASSEVFQEIQIVQRS